jgi:hypothetical protein
VSAFVTGIAAGFQGGDVLEGFKSGFIVGLSGAALGTAIGGLNIAFQYTAGGAKFITAAEAADAFVRVAARSSFTSAVSNATVQSAGAAGLPSDWQTGLAIVAPLISSYAYDNYIIKDSGAASAAGESQREAAKGGVQQANTLEGHTTTTIEAADQSTGYERYAATVSEYNVLKDGPAPTGNCLRDLWNKAVALSMNHDHFGRLPASLDSIYRDVQSVVDALGDPLQRTEEMFWKVIGEGSHLVQDHLTLGHMVPGTSLLWGPPGAPLRFVIHQVFGGEVAFRNAQVRATRELLLKFPPVT